MKTIRKKDVLKRVAPVFLLSVFGLFLWFGIFYQKEQEEVILPKQNIGQELRIESDIVSPETISPEVPEEIRSLFDLTNKVRGTEIYYSKRLGIAFTYNRFGLSLSDYEFDAKVAEQGNMIFVYHPEYGYADGNGQSIEVFEKDPNISLEDAIEARFLTEYSPEDCFVEVLEDGQALSDNPEDSMSHVVKTVISYPQSDNAESPWWENAFKCPEGYSLSNGEAYFLMNTEAPDRFVYVSIGQSVITTDGSAYSEGEVFNRWEESLRIVEK